MFVKTTKAPFHFWDFLDPPDIYFMTNFMQKKTKKLDEPILRS